MKKIGVLFSGSGVYDGTEIHEAVFTLLALEEAGLEAVCIAPNTNQHHVVNHLTGDEMNETRNVLVESARIARGTIQDLAEVNLNELDGLAIPGGFGTAKNHTKWAFEGPGGAINTDVQKLIIHMVSAQKPIAALCMGPTTVAKALEGTEYHVSLSVGSTAAPSPYDIPSISGGMEKVGAKTIEKTAAEVSVDNEHKIVCAPCYMMEASISDIRANSKAAIDQLAKWL